MGDKIYQNIGHVEKMKLNLPATVQFVPICNDIKSGQWNRKSMINGIQLHAMKIKINQGKNNKYLL